MNRYPLPDGLYQVSAKYFEASFEIKNGTIIRCAPILKRNLSYWITKAERIGEAHD